MNPGHNVLIVVVVTSASAFSCATQPATADASADVSGPPPPLPTCVIGVWLDGQHACANGITPEALQSDCLQSNTLVLAQGGMSMDLILTWSATSHTFSAVGGSGGVLQGTWQLVGLNTTSPQLLQTFSTNTTYETGIACFQNQLVRPPESDAGQLGTTYDRADQRLTTGVLGASSTPWTAQPY
jgi:hypothetical protein